MQRPVLVGEYDVTIDAKNRIAVPARLRGAFARGIYLTKGVDACLAAYAPEEFESFLEEQTGGDSRLDRAVRDRERFAAASAVYQELDGQGRVTVPARHLQYAGIAREATVIGVKDHIEVWDRGAWSTYLARLEEEADAAADEPATA